MRFHIAERIRIIFILGLRISHIENIKKNTYRNSPSSVENGELREEREKQKKIFPNSKINIKLLASNIKSKQEAAKKTAQKIYWKKESES